MKPHKKLSNASLPQEEVTVKAEKRKICLLKNKINEVNSKKLKTETGDEAVDDEVQVRVYYYCNI